MKSAKWEEDVIETMEKIGKEVGGIIGKKVGEITVDIIKWTFENVSGVEMFVHLPYS